MCPRDFSNKIYCILHFQQHPEKKYTVLEIATQLQCNSMEAYATLETLCEMKVLEKRIENRGVHYHYLSPQILDIN